MADAPVPDVPGRCLNIFKVEKISSTRIDNIFIGIIQYIPGVLPHMADSFTLLFFDIENNVSKKSLINSNLLLFKMILHQTGCSNFSR